MRIRLENALRCLKENEPASAPTETSPEAKSMTNKPQYNTNIVSEICQELDKRINGDFLVAYNKLDKAGQMAFDMGWDCERFMNRGKK